MTIENIGDLGDFIAAIATVITLIYLSFQIRASNRLARAEASRIPNSDLNVINSAFANNPAFLGAMRQILTGAERPDLAPHERTVMDMYLVSATNIQEQLAREVREGILDDDALDFGGAGLFLLPCYRTSWPLYRTYLSSGFVQQFEQRFNLDPSIEVVI